MRDVKPIFFITGTDTGAGKTVLTALLAQFLTERGVKVAALKPLCSGGRDDARVLRAALARRHDRRTATAMAAQIARFCAGAMILVGFFYDFWLILIGIFVLLGASAEEQAASDADHHRDGTHGPPGGARRTEGAETEGGRDERR